MDASKAQQQHHQRPPQPSAPVSSAAVTTARANAPAGNPPSDSPPPPPDSRMQAAMAFVQREFRRRPDLAEIAKAAHLSRYHFHRSFRKAFGKTPKQCMDEMQIAEVQRLILGGSTLMQAAREVGFTQQSHLTARFKKATGLTPKAWLLLARAKAAQGERA